jgi:hypothetical protein
MQNSPVNIFRRPTLKRGARVQKEPLFQTNQTSVVLLVVEG